MTSSCLQTPTQFSLDITLPKFATFETFVDSSEGQLQSDLQTLTQQHSTEPQQYFIWGAPNTGKTHLLQAICNQLASSKQEFIYLPMKELATQSPELLTDLQQLDVLCMDDLECVLGNEQWDKQLFNLINELRANNKSIVMTAKVNPTEAQVTFADLASRLVWGPVYKLNALDDAQKSKAIQVHAQARGLEITNEATSYLFNHFPREFRKQIELLDQLDKESLAKQKAKVTVPFIKEVLENN